MITFAFPHVMQLKPMTRPVFVVGITKENVMALVSKRST